MELNSNKKDKSFKLEILMLKAVEAAERNIGSGLWTLETAQLYLKNKAIELGLD